VADNPGLQHELNEDHQTVTYCSGEALEILYDSTSDNIVLGMDMTKITTAIGTYTKTQSDARFRLISDSYLQCKFILNQNQTLDIN
jgi:hypothetical protein